MQRTSRGTTHLKPHSPNKWQVEGEEGMDLQKLQLFYLERTAHADKTEETTKAFR